MKQNVVNAFEKAADAFYAINWSETDVAEVREVLLDNIGADMILEEFCTLLECLDKASFNKFQKMLIRTAICELAA